MTKVVESYVSFKFTKLLMILVGMKIPKSYQQRIMYDCILTFTTFIMIVSVVVQTADLCFSWGDLYAISYIAPRVTFVVLEFFKLCIFIYKRNELFQLTQFAEDKIWNINFDSAEMKVLDKCNKKSIAGMVLLCILGHTVTCHYLIGPIFDAMDTNERILPYPIWFDWPVTETPCYELMYLVEIVGTIIAVNTSVALSMFLYHTNIFAGGLFYILQSKIEIICDTNADSSNEKLSKDDSITEVNQEKLKYCVKLHQLLISYLEKMEKMYSYVLLMIVICTILILCFCGFQSVLGTQGTSLHRQFLSVECSLAFTTEFAQFCFSCNDIIEASTAIGEATYRSKWYNLMDNKNGRAIRQGLIIMAMRSRQPCTLTLGKFCPMSLQMFTSVLNTALSYITVLRSVNDDD